MTIHWIAFEFEPGRQKVKCQKVIIKGLNKKGIKQYEEYSFCTS